MYAVVDVAARRGPRGAEGKRRRCVKSTVRCERLTRAEVAELADARDSKSREVTPHVGSIPTFGIRILLPSRLRVCTTGDKGREMADWLDPLCSRLHAGGRALR